MKESKLLFSERCRRNQRLKKKELTASQQPLRQVHKAGADNKRVAFLDRSELQGLLCHYTFPLPL